MRKTRAITKQVKRLCRAAKVKRKIYVNERGIHIDEDVVFFLPVHNFIARLALAINESPELTKLQKAQDHALKQLKEIDTSGWNV